MNEDTAVRCHGGCDLTRQPGVEAPGQPAGFWIRLLSDLIDAALLGVIGFLISLPFRDALSRMGGRAIFIGAAISLLYSGVLQSRFGGGQTPAKRLLKLRVVRVDGSLLSLDRALARWGLLSLMIYGGAIASVLAGVMPFLNAGAVAATATGVQIALTLGCAFLVPFHPLKRGLHDLLAGSLVISRTMPPAAVIAAGTNPRRDRILVGVAVGVTAGVAALFILAATAASLAVGQTGTAAANSGAERVRVIEAMRASGVEEPNVRDVLISRGSGSTTEHNIVFTGRIPTGAGTRPAWELHEQAVAAMRAHLPLEGVDAIGTDLHAGFNIGIYKSEERYQKLERRGLTGPPAELIEPRPAP